MKQKKLKWKYKIFIIFIFKNPKKFISWDSAMLDKIFETINEIEQNWTGLENFYICFSVLSD